MSKKFKVNLSYNTYSILMNDIDAFHFYKKSGETNKNKFINRLIMNYYQIINSKIDNLEQKLNKLIKEYGDSKKDFSKQIIIEEIIKFNNKELDNDYKKDFELTFISTKESEDAINDIEYNEYVAYLSISGYLRNLFNEYVKLNQDEREKIIFKEEYEAIMRAIKNNKKIHFVTQNNENSINKYDVNPYGIYSTKDRQYLYLVYYLKNSYNVININKLYNLVILKEEKDELKDEIKNKILLDLDSNSPQFINYGIIKCKVKLTAKGKKQYNKIFINRPTPYLIQDDIYYFETSSFQLFMYFSRFGKEAIILDNKELKNKLMKFYLDGYNALKNHELIKD